LELTFLFLPQKVVVGLSWHSYRGCWGRGTGEEVVGTELMVPCPIGLNNVAVAWPCRDNENGGSTDWVKLTITQFWHKDGAIQKGLPDSDYASTPIYSVNFTSRFFYQGLNAAQQRGTRKKNIVK
jgi:hypothetical protein